MVDDRKPSLIGAPSAVSAGGAATAGAATATEQAQDVSKRDQIVSVVPEDSVHITPPRHVPIYYLWVVCCSLLTVLLVPLSFTILALLHHGRNTSSATAHVTADDSNPEGPQDTCTIPPEARYVGKSLRHSGQVFCIYNAGSRTRKASSVYYYPLMVPVAFCNHFLYHSVSINQYIPELQSRDEQHDFGCLGLKTVKDLTRDYLDLKTHLVVGTGNSPLETAPFDTLFGSNNTMKVFVNSVNEWVRSYSFDGVFIRWETPLDSSLPTTLLSSLRAGLPSHKMLGAILPASTQFLQNYDLPKVIALVNWTIALMHDLFPKPGYDLTSCPSPLHGPDDTIEKIIRQYSTSIGNTNQTTFCFSVSCAGSSYEVDAASLVGSTGSAGLNTTGVEHPVSYDKVCKRESYAKNDTNSLCMYLDGKNSRTFFHSVWSAAAMVKGISAMLENEGIVPDPDYSCVAVWDIDLDDIWGNCSIHFLDRYPLLEGIMRAMPPLVVPPG